MSNLLPYERERIPTGEPHSEERRQQLEDLKSGKIGKMPDRYVYLHIDLRESLEDGIHIHVKLDDEGVVVDAWQEDEVVASTWKTYADMGVEVRELLTIEKQQIAKETDDE